jgi:hypothetical protein
MLPSVTDEPIGDESDHPASTEEAKDRWSVQIEWWRSMRASFSPTRCGHYST